MLYVKDHMEDCDWKNNEFATNFAHKALETQQEWIIFETTFKWSDNSDF